jgi:hypothetical protein
MVQLSLPAGPLYPAVQLELSGSHTLLPGRLALVLGGQARHCGDPGTGAYVLMEQLVHVELAGPEKVPEGQAWQFWPWLCTVHEMDTMVVPRFTLGRKSPISLALSPTSTVVPRPE